MKHPHGGFLSGLKLRSPAGLEGKVLGPAYTVLFELNARKAKRPPLKGHYVSQFALSIERMALKLTLLVGVV